MQIWDNIQFNTIGIVQISELFKYDHKVFIDVWW